MLATLLLGLILAGNHAAIASEAGASRTRLTWRPVRPNSTALHNQEHRDEGTERTTGVDAKTATHVDPQVKRVVMQDSDDPLNNPFSDPMPQSPFRTRASQSAPTTIDEQPSTGPTASAIDSVMAAQPPANSSGSERRGVAGANGQDRRLPAPNPLGPLTDAPAPGSPLESLGPEPGVVAADPKQDCDTAVRKYRANRITGALGRRILDLTLPPDEKGDPAVPPFECSLSTQTISLNSGREWAGTCYTWKASGLCHKPLYFEQAHMERYGHSWGPVLDSVISGAHFFASVPLLPYKMGLEPPCECIYPLGEYRPGSCAPHYIEPWPWSLRAVGAEAATATGLIFALP